jgi:anaerobic ribonucleoside-triphosphate reductase activating protein
MQGEYLESKQNIWLYTGYLFEQLFSDKDMYNLLKEVNVIVDGKFIKELNSPLLNYKGSSNQRIILVEPSLEKNEIVDWEEL